MATGIETLFKGTIFRSRLEARWAAMFDLLGWHWEYEPLDAAGYIPDFALLGDRPMFAEIKPALTLGELNGPVARVTKALLPYRKDVLFLGTSASFLAEKDCGWQDTRGWGNHAGLLAEFSDYYEEDGVPMYALGHAVWNLCGKCKRPSVYHEDMTWASRPCGDYDGDGYLGGEPDHLDYMWREAGNLVRWERNR